MRTAWPRAIGHLSFEDVAAFRFSGAVRFVGCWKGEWRCAGIPQTCAKRRRIDAVETSAAGDQQAVLKSVTTFVTVRKRKEDPTYWGHSYAGVRCGGSFN